MPPLIALITAGVASLIIAECQNQVVNVVRAVVASVSAIRARAANGPHLSSDSAGAVGAVRNRAA
jgi:hypothetical protein